MLALPMVQLEKAILLFNDKKFEDSKKIFTELQAYDEASDFGIEATTYLEKIRVEEELLKTQALSGSVDNSGATLPQTTESVSQNSTASGDDFWK